ncbi:hypothetical protein [Fundidesulfovibrio agrisoli]|uniref:hypothetical protein n=1 Tax=Fundidesulfovibrio agrisoli TaxID=2922717 RepID=UPI001FAB8CFA|nr:hypothetical protein [Fundidesulfovibrio agrisoli]
MVSMIRVMVAALALLVAMPCLAATPQKPLSKGFGSVNWGEDISKKQGFMKLRTDEGVDYYIFLREQTRATGFGRPTVFYAQSGGRLYAVHLRLTDGSGYDALRLELEDIYGKGKVSGKSVRWRVGPVRIKLSPDQGGTMKLSFYNPTAARINAAKSEAEPSGSELAKLLPDDYLPIKGPNLGAPIKQPDDTGIDLLPYLRDGRKLLKIKTY